MKLLTCVAYVLLANAVCSASKLSQREKKMLKKAGVFQADEDEKPQAALISNRSINSAWGSTSVAKPSASGRQSTLFDLLPDSTKHILLTSGPKTASAKVVSPEYNRSFPALKAETKDTNSVKSEAEDQSRLKRSLLLTNLLTHEVSDWESTRTRLSPVPFGASGNPYESHSANIADIHDFVMGIAPSFAILDSKVAELRAFGDEPRRRQDRGKWAKLVDEVNSKRKELEGFGAVLLDMI